MNDGIDSRRLAIDDGRDEEENCDEWDNDRRKRRGDEYKGNKKED